MAMTWNIQEIPSEQMYSTDLRREAMRPKTDYGYEYVVSGIGMTAYHVNVFSDDELVEQGADMLVDHDAGRVGFAWGSDADWADTLGMEPDELPSLFLL